MRKFWKNRKSNYLKYLKVYYLPKTYLFQTKILISLMLDLDRFAVIISSDVKHLYNPDFSMVFYSFMVSRVVGSDFKDKYW